MPEISIKDTILTSMNAQEPWPDNVKLFQPYEVEQILLPDNASCLAVQAFLKMCNLPFEVEMRWNAEFMSPSGRVPFIKCGAFVVSELEPIVQFAANKGVSLCSKLSTEERAEMRAYMSLITNVLVNAELYISWVDSDTFNAVTRVRNSSVYPWPLGWLQTRAKRNTVLKRLKALHWHDKTLEQVLADVEQCCNSLCQRLGDKDYFFGTPSPLDALIYGHVRAFLSSFGPRAPLMIKPITNSLLKHLLRMTNLTGIRLTPQEEYLINQAKQLSQRRSPERNASKSSTRVKRSKMSIQISRENMHCHRDVFGFKPFASKQIIIMTSKEGRITCEDKHRPHEYVIDILEDILIKIDEIIETKITNDYEIIVISDKGDAKTDSGAIDESIAIEDNMTKVDNNELGTIDEVIDDDGLVGVDEDVIQVIDVMDGDLGDENINDIAIDALNSDDTDSSPTELDALVFGHVFTIITTRLPCRKLADTVRKHESLVALAKRVDEQYFKRP